MFRKFSAMIYIVQLCRAAIENPDRTEYCYVDGELKEQTHIASFKFVPRHADEISLEVSKTECFIASFITSPTGISRILQH